MPIPKDLYVGSYVKSSELVKRLHAFIVSRKCQRELLASRRKTVASLIGDTRVILSFRLALEHDCHIPHYQYGFDANWLDTEMGLRISGLRYVISSNSDFSDFWVELIQQVAHQTQVAEHRVQVAMARGRPWLSNWRIQNLADRTLERAGPLVTFAEGEEHARLAEPVLAQAFPPDGVIEPVQLSSWESTPLEGKYEDGQ